jgi:hypothetical protein
VEGGSIVSTREEKEKDRKADAERLFEMQNFLCGLLSSRTEDPTRSREDVTAKIENHGT